MLESSVVLTRSKPEKIIVAVWLVTQALVFAYCISGWSLSRDAMHAKPDVIGEPIQIGAIVFVRKHSLNGLIVPS
jgi:hypothetical protein